MSNWFKIRNLLKHQPYFYTRYEGGYWIDWDSNVILTKKHLKQRGDTVMVGSLVVHTIAFGHIAAGYPYFARWDSINGFTQIPDDIAW